VKRQLNNIKERHNRDPARAFRIYARKCSTTKDHNYGSSLALLIRGIHDSGVQKSSALMSYNCIIYSLK